MKRMVTKLFLLSALLAIPGAIRTPPALADNGPPIKSFSGHFLAGGQDIFVSGAVRFDAVLKQGPPIAPGPPLRIVATLLGVVAANTATGATYIGARASVYDGTAGGSFSFTGDYLLVGTHVMAAGPPILPLQLRYDNVTVGTDGSLTVGNIFVVSQGPD